MNDILLGLLLVLVAFLGALLLHHLKSSEERNRADHAQLFKAVSGVQTEVSDLKGDVKVLRDRSDRAERAERVDRSDSGD